MSDSFALKRSPYLDIPLQLVMSISLGLQIIGTLGLTAPVISDRHSWWIGGLALMLLSCGLNLLASHWIRQLLLSLNFAINPSQPPISEDAISPPTQLKASEVILAKAFVQLNYLVENSPLATIRWNKDFKVEYWSRQAEKMFGWQAREVLGKSMYDWQFVFEEDREKVNQCITESLSGNYTTCENRNYRKDGSIVYCEWYNSSLVDESGNLVSMLSLVQDISDRKRIEKELQESKARLQALFDNSPAIISIKDLEGRYLSVNQEMVYLLQTPESEILGKTDFDFLPADTAKHIRAQELQAIFEGIAISSEQSLLFHDQVHTFLITKFPILDEHDKPYALAGICLDISDRKRIEQELTYSKELRESIYNNSTDAIFLVDPLSLLVFDCNNRAVAMFEVESKRQLIGIAGHTLQKQMFTDAEMESIVKDISECGFWSREIEYVTKKGKHFWGNLACKQIIVADREIHLVRVTDISNRKQVESIIQQSESRFQKIANFSPEAIYILVRHPDGRTNFEYASAASEDLLGVSIDYLLHNSSLRYELFHPEDLAGYEQAMINSLKTMQPLNHEWRIITPQGQIKWLSSRACPERRENGDVVWYGFAFDITDRKQAEIDLAQAEASLREANQELQKLVNLDGLTKIANRRCFDERLVVEWKRLYREQQPLSLLMFDVDYFKRYNDRYGHQLGDECLIKIAQTVEHVISRPADLVARYGGEEFIVILPNTSLVGAVAIANHIEEEIKSLQIPHQDSDVSDLVTVSIGIACDIPDLERSPYVLVNQADQALYYAKQQGRNQSVIFAEKDSTEYCLRFKV